MAGLPVPSPISDADYESIEAAVVETTRGRWFLAEFARRNRHAETKGLLDVLQRIEAKIDAPRHDPQLDRVRMNILEMAQAIARTKDEIAAIKPTQQVEGRFGEATEELDAIVTTTETATDDILRAAEQIQEVAWTLRERGFEGPICDMLDERATDIYTACSFQDLTGQRTRKVISVLRYLEARINAMIDIWGVDGALPSRAAQTDRTAQPADVPLGRKLANGPARLGEGLEQTAVDTMLGPDESAADTFAALSIDGIMAAGTVEFEAVGVHAGDDGFAPAEAPPQPEDAEVTAIAPAAASAEEPTETVDIEAIDLGAIVGLAEAALAEAAADEDDTARSFEIDVGGGLAAPSEPVPHAEDAPSIATDLDIRIVDLLEPDAFDELIAVDVPHSEDETKAGPAAADAPEPASGATASIVPALPPVESNAVRLSTADIDQLTPAERTALFT